MLLLRGDRDRGVVPTATKLERYAGWLDSGALVVRFEDLVGSAGGGADAARDATLRSIFEHLGAEVDDALVAGIGRRLFSSKSPTFHRGAIGQWRTHFDPEIEAAFAGTVGEDLMGRYGYSGPG